MKDNVIIDYLNTTLGKKMELEPYGKTKKLPLFFREGYNFKILKFFDHTLLLANPKPDSDITPAGFKKQLDTLRKYSDLEPILVLETIDPFLRKRLIEYKISFIVPGTQMYLPQLMIDLKEHFSKKNEKRMRLSPSAQVVILSDIYNRLERPITPVQLGAKFGYTKMTMSRVIDELDHLGICRVEQKGKNRFASIEPESITLWERIRTHLRSPVKRRVYASSQKNIRHSGYPKSGITALAELTLLSPGIIPVYAVSKEEFAVLQKRGVIREVENAFDAQFELEVWHYNPSILNNDNDLVDTLSLFLSLREEPDERVQLALKELMEKFRWR